MSPEQRLAAAYAAAGVTFIGLVFWAAYAVSGDRSLHLRRPAHPQRITYVYDQRSQRCKAIVQWCATQPPEVRPIDCDEALRALGTEER